MGHFFSAVLKDIHIGAQAVEKAIPAIQKQEPLIEGLTAVLLPLGVGTTAVTIERAAFSALGAIAAAVHSLDDAAVANGVNIALDAATVKDFKALFTALKPQLAASGVKV